MNKSTNKTRNQGLPQQNVQAADNLHSELQNEDDEMTRKQEECFRMALSCARDEGKLQIGGQKATVLNMKLVIRRLSRGNSFF